MKYSLERTRTERAIVICLPWEESWKFQQEQSIAVRAERWSRIVRIGISDDDEDGGRV